MKMLSQLGTNQPTNRQTDQLLGLLEWLFATKNYPLHNLQPQTYHRGRVSLDRRSGDEANHGGDGEEDGEGDEKEPDRAEDREDEVEVEVSAGDGVGGGEGGEPGLGAEHHQP